MLHNLAVRLVDILFKDREHDNTYYICSYGLELLLYSALSTAGLILIGFLFHDVPNCIIIISVFYICQTVGGGKHANTHMMCFVTMALFLCLALLACSFSFGIYFNASVAFASLGYLFIQPLVLHKNKAYLEYKKKHIVTMSRICSLLLALLYIITLLIKQEYCQAISISLLYAAISRFSGQHSKYPQD